MEDSDSVDIRATARGRGHWRSSAATSIIGARAGGERYFKAQTVGWILANDPQQKESEPAFMAS